MTPRPNASAHVLRAGVVAALLAVIAACRPAAPAAALPALVPHPQLPAAFQEEFVKRQAAAMAAPAQAEPARRLARLCQANRLYAEARACYGVIAALAPGLTARDHYALADIAQDESDLGTAQRELRAALAQEPDYLPARVALAETLFKSGEEAAAEREYAVILAREANQPEASVGLARLELQRGEDPAAVARLEKLLAAHPTAIPAAALLAKVLERRGDAARAGALSQWSQSQPAAPLADPWRDELLLDCYDAQRLSLTFEEYFKTNRMSEAVPLLDRLAVLDPDGPITKMFRGVSHAKAMEHITAVREYYAALGNGGDPEKVAPYLVQSLLALGNVDEARTVIAGYYAKAPDSLPLAKSYAEVAARTGDVPLGRSLLEKILAKEPYLRAQNMALARILWSAGERDAAAQPLQRVAEAFPDDLPSRALLGEYHLGRGDPLAAIKVLEPALALPAAAPVQASLKALASAAYVRAGTEAAERNDPVAALDWANRAAAVTPDDWEAHAFRAGVATQLKQFGPAVDSLERLAALQPRNPTIALSLGDVLYQAGDVAAARRHWTEGRRLVAAGDVPLQQALDDRLAGRITDETFK